MANAKKRTPRFFPNFRTGKNGTEKMLEEKPQDFVPQKEYAQKLLEECLQKGCTPKGAVIKVLYSYVK
jgi:hypothetical protein